MVSIVNLSKVNNIINILLTCSLIAIVIGGGRFCSCETLSWVGIDVHGHHHGNCNEGDHEDEHHDCCDEVEPFEGVLPELVAIQEDKELSNDSFFKLSSEQSMNSSFALASPSSGRHPPPDTPALSSSISLTLLQRFLV